MTLTQRPPRRIGRSLSAMLLAVALVAILFAAFRSYVTILGQPRALPTFGDRMAYENARIADDLSIRVGPNTFSVVSVVRNDRDGSLHWEDGRGKASSVFEGSRRSIDDSKGCLARHRDH